jgi:hypothetical protein
MLMLKGCFSLCCVQTYGHELIMQSSRPENAQLDVEGSA